MRPPRTRWSLAFFLAAGRGAGPPPNRWLFSPLLRDIGLGFSIECLMLLFILGFGRRRSLLIRLLTPCFHLDDCHPFQSIPGPKKFLLLLASRAPFVQISGRTTHTLHFSPPLLRLRLAATFHHVTFQSFHRQMGFLFFCRTRQICVMSCSVLSFDDRGCSCVNT